MNAYASPPGPKWRRHLALVFRAEREGRYEHLHVWEDHGDFRKGRLFQCFCGKRITQRDLDNVSYAEAMIDLFRPMRDDCLRGVVIGLSARH